MSISNLDALLIQIVCNNIESGLTVLAEPERARLHALTLTVRISDEELARDFRKATMSIGTGPLYGTHWEFIKDLRDRYEGIGKYAPAQQPPAAPQPEPQAQNNIINRHKTNEQQRT